MTSKIENIINLSSLFKQDNQEPLVFSPGQRKISRAIITKEDPRVWVSCITQYGKSLCVALSVIIRAVAFSEKWCIIGATEKKSRIIMNYVIGHLFDHPLFESQLEMSGDSSYESLKRERSKNRLTFKRGGEILILSAQAGNSQAVQDALTGFGCQNIILDDSPLIPDPLYAMVKRMLGGHKDNFLMEIGNPFYLNHFHKAYQNPKYKKIKLDYNTAIKEGRVSADFIEEMRGEAFFDILYGCNFPKMEEIDDKGWWHLFTETFLKARMIDIPEIKGRSRLGIDIGGGSAFNTFTLRNENKAKLIHKDRDPDTMATVGKIRNFMSLHNVLPEDVFIDDTGIGHGVSDRLHEIGVMVNRVVVGEKASDDRFINIRAEMYWNTKEWMKGGGMLDNDAGYLQLQDIKYKVASDKRIKLMSKEDMKKDSILSPDVADSLALTFCEQDVPEPEEESYENEEELVEEVLHV